MCKIKLLVLLVACLVVWQLRSQPTSSVGRQSYLILNLAKKYHYKLPEINDSFSLDVYSTFINDLDPSGYYFLSSDIEIFEKYKYTIDDEIKAKTSGFFSEVAKIYANRLKSVDSLLTVFEKEQFDFQKREYFNSENDGSTDFVSNFSELSIKWKIWLKYAILDELISGDYFDDPLNESKENLLAKINVVKAEIFKNERYTVKSFINNPEGYENYLSTFYLDAIARTFDPHTSYMSGIERDEYVEELSEGNRMYGFTVEEDEKGIIRISDLMPGSPAWNCNELNKGDEVLSIRFEDGKEIDMTIADINDVRVMFNNTKSESLTIEVKKANGEVVSVDLSKGEVYLANDVIQNFVLKGDHAIGYIALPDFYSSWDGDEGLGCANDVARAIVKLQKDNISGLILDLRNNGGGSLREAIDLAGIFLDWGPLAISCHKDGEPFSLKDMNKGSIYNGPLVILVNGLSASASEIITAALQDYNRAIVIGSPTYGKATSQVILPLDPSFNFGTSDPKLVDETYGYLKITRGAFYRISKRSHQGAGVIPDIIMPDFYDIYDYKESSHKNFIRLDSVQKKVYYTAFESFPQKIFELSQQRILANQSVQRLNFMIDSVIQMRDVREEIPLSLEEFCQYEKTYSNLFEELYKLEFAEQNYFKVFNSQIDMELIEIDAYRREINTEIIERIQEDFYISEAYNVLIDYLTLK